MLQTNTRFSNFSYIETLLQTTAIERGPIVATNDFQMSIINQLINVPNCHSTQEDWVIHSCA